MAGKLQAVNNSTLGFLGLNTQDNGVTLDSGYATKALNCVIDKSGRLGSRRGWQMVTTSDTNAVGTATFATNQMTVIATTSGTFSIGDTVVASGVTEGTYIIGNPSANVYTLSTTPGTLSLRNVSTISGLSSFETIESIFEFVTVGGNSTILSAGDGKIFVGTTTLHRKLVYGPDSGGPVPLTTQPDYTNYNRWQWAALQEDAGANAKSYAVAVQRGKNALVYRQAGHSSSAPFVLQKIGDGYSTNPAGITTFDPDCCHAAFGRMWYGGLTETRLTVFFSGLLDPVDFAGADAGFIDVSSKIGNNDEITAITSHNGYLIVFCKRNIVILSGAETPTSDIAVADVIPGVGCIARDSVQQAGNDIIFLSASGVRSLSRTVQEKSMPMRELSLNIRDDLVSYLQGEVANSIKSVYFERDAFYLLVLPSLNQILYFDLRRVLDNGAARVTVWDSMIPTAFCSALDKNLYLGKAGGIAKYFGYSDNGTPYRMEYYSANTDFGQPFTLKILKKAKVILIASGSQDIIIKYGFDYKTDYTARVYTKDFIGASAQYSNAVNFTGSRSGTTLTTINNPPLAIGMGVYTTSGTNLGTITAGSNNTWTVSNSGTIASTSMVAAVPGGSEYSNIPGQPGYTGAEYTAGTAIAEVDLNLGGSGKVLQFGVEATVDGAPLSLQQMSVYIKAGKMI